jgi:hypothetical protein
VPLYLKKSLGLFGGLLRLNFSKHGVGASLGVKGFRISTGPRGPMLNAGMHGIYYRRSLKSSRFGR